MIKTRSAMFTATIPRALEGHPHDQVVEILKEKKFLWIRWYQVKETRVFVTMSDVHRVLNILNIIESDRLAAEGKVSAKL